MCEFLAPRGGLDSNHYRIIAWGNQVLWNGKYVSYTSAWCIPEANFYSSTDGLFPQKVDWSANNWQFPGLIVFLPVPWCVASEHLVHLEIGTASVESILRHLTGSIQIIAEFEFIYPKHAFSRQSWPYCNISDVASNSTSNSKAFAHWHLTDFWHRFILYSPYPPSDLWHLLQLLRNWAALFYEQTGRFDFNPIRPHWKMQQGALIVKNIKVTDLSHGCRSVLWEPVV